MDNKDPLYEDEDAPQGFTLVPTGLQFGKVIDLDIETDFKSRKGNYGWKFEIEVEFEEGGTIKFWMDTSSLFGAKCVHDCLLNLGVKYEIPDKNKITKGTGQPRKSFTKALADISATTGEITIKKDGLVGKKGVFQVIHQKRCADCKWLFPVKETECKNKSCGASLADAKVYAGIDSTSILPPVERESKLAPDIEQTDKEPEGAPDDDLPF